MAFQLTSQHHIRCRQTFQHPGGTNVVGVLYTLTGIAFGEAFGAANTWVAHKIRFDIPIPDVGDGMWLLHWAPSVNLASIGRNEESRWSGWSINNYRMLNGGFNKRVKAVEMECDIAARGSGVVVWRLSYSVQLLGNYFRPFGE